MDAALEERSKVLILPPIPLPPIAVTVGAVAFKLANERVAESGERKTSARALACQEPLAFDRSGLPMEPVAIICSQDAELYIILEYILGVDGYKTVLAGTVEEAVERTRETSPTAIILDCRSGGLPVATLCAQLKQDPTTRAIHLVALIAPGAEDQHIALLKAGVDDSLVRPLVPAKFLASLRSKRTADVRGNLRGHPVLNFGDLELRSESFRVRRDESEIQLGAIEFRLLRHLLENPGGVFSRENLIAIAWPDNIHVDARTVDVHVSRLRKLLLKLGLRSVIRTVRSAGYTLDDKNGS